MTGLPGKHARASEIVIWIFIAVYAAASLFPSSPVLREVFRLVAAVHVAAAQIPQRLTLTFPVLNAAARVLFLVTGAEKAKILRKVLDERATLPATMVRPTDGELIWLVDRAAASLLQISQAR